MWRDGKANKFITLAVMIFRLKLEGCALNWEKSKPMRCVSGVQQAVVVADQDDPDNQLIYAFVVSSVPLNLAALMDALSKNLPAYMLPNRLLAMSELPLSDNGKCCRKTLLDLARAYSASRVDLRETPPCATYRCHRLNRRCGLCNNWRRILHYTITPPPCCLKENWIARGWTARFVN